MEKKIPLKLPPGMVRNGTLYQSAGRWRDGNLVRFFQNTIRPVGGWSAMTLTGATITGQPRGMLSFTPEVLGVEQLPILVVGTTNGLYVIRNSIVYDITPTGLVSDTGRLWSLEVFGSYLVAVASNPVDYTKNAGPYLWTGDLGARADRIAEAPASPTAVVATDERFLFLLGGVDPLGLIQYHFPTTPNQRTVFFASQESYSDWTPTDENSAGSYELATEGRLRCGKRSRGQTLLWTSKDLHAATYIGGEFVFRFTQAGDKCGAISTHAVATRDTTAIWMSENSFWTYDGFAKEMPCDVHDAVFGNINRDYQHLVWCFYNTRYGEVTWFYPSAASTVPDKYVTFSSEGHWVTGTLTRHAGVSTHSPGVVPVMADGSGVIYNHETGNVDVSLAYLESGPVELDDGNIVMRVQKVIPDDKTAGDVSLTLYGQMNPDDSETTYGPYTLSSETDVRLTARSVRVRLTGAVATDWRVGVVRLGVLPGGAR